MTGPSSELFVTGGFDEYGGGTRNVTASIPNGNHIKITCEGADGGGESLITPDQARYLGRSLIKLADSISDFWSRRAASGA